MFDAPYESKFVDDPKGKVHYLDTGEGEVVFLIQGGGPGAYGYSNYRRNIGPLADQGRRIITMDLPGFGKSDKRRGYEGLFDPMAEAVLDIMDHEGIEKASFVGNSLGGGTSLRFALDNPDRTHKLMLMGPGGSIPMTSTFPTEGLSRMLTFYDGEGPTIEKLRKVVELLVYDPSEISDDLLEERLKTAMAPQTMQDPPLRGQAANPRNDLWRERLDELPHPTLILWGREDRVLPLDAAFILLKTIPNADLHVFSKCGHWCQWERADEFNHIIGSFLDRPY
ncbi:alpha/beta fold hydrolase [Henriciella litoralis]|uniref:alpha/beta fold hydrolase n=1 Tax=Henriciella litoralis TaxID=568102 RepID=UPI000A06C0CA|nr:alpha/beta fold hydrolase [Henriciella litoralis]